MSTESLAERTVYALARVQVIGATMSSNHPMRHTVRNLKRMAEQTISDAIQKATDISYLAEQVVKDHDTGGAA